ncbi:PREDICTED: vascular non-inflammatory molecule 3 isoform X2 [Condylura cristata]|uniref:vascular non-inflammatory molecule 3 isoform X2 n=1 Tax=Condylura cristata TaxID=143302 RepID=UPI0006439401|nr:PREDICTED: vascular non-inflammatory molecule 3 isoform X2 [Condylura cristata]
MISSYFPNCVAVFALLILSVGALETFIAAVYEHAVILPNRTETAVPKEEALLLMNKNLDVLEKAVKLAARQGAHIIVTPEDGVYGWVFTRETIYPYLEDIPDPKVDWIPCRDPKRFGYTPVQERLSCLARDNSIYVVANIGDKKPCNAGDPQCPPDGRYQYNTDMVFDSEGRLVARYHKICTLLKCQTTDLRTCGEPVGSAFTKFEEFSLSGTFGTSYVFPQMVLSGSQLAPEGHYEVLGDGRLKSRGGVPLPILVMALYGRVFEKDPLRLGQGPGKSP